MVDRILNGKAVFRQTRADEHEVLTSIGRTAVLMAPLTEHRGVSHRVELQNIGAGFSIAGAAVGILAMNAKPQADTRYWHGLPNAVHVHSLTMPSGSYEARFNFFDGNGGILREMTRHVRVDVSTEKPTVIWVRSR